MGAAIAFLATPLVIPHANQHEAILAELGVVLAIAALPSMRTGLVMAAIATHAALWLTGPILQAQSGEASAWLLFVSIAGWLAVVTWLALREESVDDTRMGRLAPLPSGQAE
jgi:hypothetical protein